MGNSRYKPADVQHVKPSSLAMIRSTGSDATVVVELWGADQRPIVFGSNPYISITVSSTASSLVTFVGSSWPSVDIVGGRLYVASGSAIRYNFGAVDGVLATSMAPTTSSPGVLGIGETLLFGRYTGQDASTAISATVTVDSEFPAAAALADGTTNPTTTVVGAMAETWNGATWDRWLANRAVVARPTVTVDTAAYADLDCIGGIITLSNFTVVSGGLAKIHAIEITELGAQKPPVTITFYKATPAGGTYTDNAALVIDATDVADRTGIPVTFVAGDYAAHGTHQVAALVFEPFVVECAATSLFMLIQANGAYDAVAATDFKMRILYERVM